jgi:hypothetical protein
VCAINISVIFEPTRKAGEREDQQKENAMNSENEERRGKTEEG